MKNADFSARILEKWSAEERCCFTAAVVSGAAAHFYMLANKIPNVDDVNNIEGYGGGAVLGRFILPYTHRLFSAVSAPALNGIIAILLYALAASLAVRTLKIRNRTAAALCGILWLTSPFMTSTMTYMFTVADYGLAVLAACLAACLFTGEDHVILRGAAGILCLFFSMGIYQAYFPLAVSLCLAAAVASLIRGEAVGNVTVRGARSLAFLGLSAAAYFLYARTLPLSDFHGMNGMGDHFLTRLPVTVARAYHRFLQYFLTSVPSYVRQGEYRLQLMMFAAAGVCLVLILLRNKRTEPSRLALTAAGFFLMPLSVSLVYVMAPDVQKASTLMVFPYVMTWTFGALLLSEWNGMPAGEGKKAAAALALSAVLTVSLAGISYEGFRTAHEAYFRSALSFERIEAYFNRLLVRLEETEGYHYGDPVAIVGDSWPDPNVLSSYNLNADEYADLEGFTIESTLFTSGNRDKFMRTYLGVEITDLPTGYYQELVQTETFRNMPVFPEKGCVAREGEYWLIKVEK